jgi:hypothetical protein
VELEVEVEVEVAVAAVERKMMILPMFGPGALEIGFSFVRLELQIPPSLNLKTVLVVVVVVGVVGVEAESAQLFL